MNINAAFPSKWMKTTDCMDADGESIDLVLTIDDVAMEQIGQGAEAQEKPVVYFTDSDKGLILNKTNANTIATLYGPDTDAWTGKKIILFATWESVQGKQTEVLRVKPKAPGARRNGQPAPAAAPVSVKEARNLASAAAQAPPADDDGDDPFAEQ